MRERRLGATSVKVGGRHISPINGVMNAMSVNATSGRRVCTLCGGGVNTISGSVGGRNISAIDKRDISAMRERRFDVIGRGIGTSDKGKVRTISRGVGERNISTINRMVVHVRTVNGTTSGGSVNTISRSGEVGGRNISAVSVRSINATGGRRMKRGRVHTISGTVDGWNISTTDGGRVNVTN